MYRKILLSMMLAVFLVACGQGIEEPKNNEDAPETETTTSMEKKPDTNVEEESDSEPEADKTDTVDTESAAKDADNKSKKQESLTDLKVHYIDVGQADATLFQYADGDQTYTILYDTGNWNKNDVVTYLASQKVSTIDLIVVSHSDADHIGQLAEIVNTYDVGEVWLSGNESSSQTFQRAIEAVLSSDADYHEPRTGEEFEIGPMKIDVVHPKSISGKANEESVSLLFTYGAIKFLFTGDAGKRDELQMMQSGIDIQADILQLGHHGSNTSTDPAFISKVNPAVAIYSAGAGNSYGHPHGEVVAQIQNAGIALYGTDVHGTIIVTTDGKKYDIKTKADGTITPKSTGSANSNSTKAKEPEKKEKSASTNANCIDINQASLEQVQNIIHIGPVRAQELIDKRPYQSVEGLTSIKGIGPARIADIKSQGLACVGG